MDKVVAILHGPGHIVAYQSHAAIMLLGLIIGIPLREALCDSIGESFVPIFELLDDVYATGISLRVDMAGGVMWLMRLADESGVALYYERVPALLSREPRVGFAQLALVE